MLSRDPRSDLFRDSPFAVLFFEDVETSVSAVAGTELGNDDDAVAAVAVKAYGGECDDAGSLRTALSE